MYNALLAQGTIRLHEWQQNQRDILSMTHNQQNTAQTAVGFRLWSNRFFLRFFLSENMRHAFAYVSVYMGTGIKFIHVNVLAIKMFAFKKMLVTYNTMYIIDVLHNQFKAASNLSLSIYIIRMFCVLLSIYTNQSRYPPKKHKSMKINALIKDSLNPPIYLTRPQA